MNKKINTDNLDSFFSFTSKIVIIIPIFILVISLFLKFNTPNKSFPVLTKINPTTTPIIKNSDFKFDLRGPIVCETFFIKNKKILFKNKSTNYLLNGDCLYIWNTSESDGEKKCGLSGYVNMAENYLGSFSINDLITNNMVKDFIKNKNIDLTSVTKNCERKEIEDIYIFEIPEKVVFRS